MKELIFWVNWLKIVSVVFASFGIFLAFFNQIPFFADLINPVFFEETLISSELKYFQQWLYGLLGATCVMVGILIFFIVDNAYRNRDRWAWKCILIGLIGWFIIDQPISLYFSVYFNVVFNFGLLIAVLIPLICTKRYFERTD